MVALLDAHPLQGNNQACNKLISLCDPAYHADIVAAAKRLHTKIEQVTAKQYADELAKTNIHQLTNSIQRLVYDCEQKLAALVDKSGSSSKGLKQTLVSGIPAWYKNADDCVEKSILVTLLLCSGSLNNWEALPAVFGGFQGSRSAGDAQQIIIEYLQEVFRAECIKNVLYAVGIPGAC